MKLTLHDARRVSELVIPSTVHMTRQERFDGICKMLDDLERLAEKDGCVAAAWALEWITESQDKVKGDSKMQLVDQGRCDRCGKFGEIVRLIPKDREVGSTTYIILCRACLAYSWNCLNFCKHE